MNLALIPARGGSKRIPGKNIKEFCGKPLIAWSIEAAANAPGIDRIIVSTDDPAIAKIATAHGAEVPFLRPAALADDHTHTGDVIAHAVAWCEAQNQNPSLVCCLYATAAFARSHDIQRGLEIMNSTESAYAFTVTTFPYPIQRALRLSADGALEMFWPEHRATRSQDLQEAYHDAGQFYWGRPDAWRGKLPVFGPDSAPIILPRHRVQDIDTPEDWTRAEQLFRQLGFDN